MGWRNHRYDDDYDDDLDIGRGRRSAPPNRGSPGWAMASFVLSMLNGLFLFGVFFIAVMINLNQNAPLPDNDPRMVMLGFGFLAGLAFAVLGLVLGFVGIGQNSGTIFAVLGIVFNGLILVGVLGLMVVGLAVGG